MIEIGLVQYVRFQFINFSNQKTILVPWISPKWTDYTPNNMFLNDVFTFLII